MVLCSGLKVASKDEILELLPKHISPHHPSFQCIGELRPEQIRAQIERIKLFRVRKPGVYLSHYDAYLQSMKRHGPNIATASSQQAPSWMDSSASRNGDTGDFLDADYYNNNSSSSNSNNLRVPRSTIQSSSSAPSTYIDPSLFDLNFDNDVGRKALTQAFQNLTADMTTMSTVIGQQSSLVNDFNKSIKSQRTVLDDLNRKWSSLKRVIDAQSAHDEACRASSSQYNNSKSSVNMPRNNNPMSNERASSTTSSSYPPFIFGDQDEADIIIGMNKVADANRRPYESDSRGRFIEPVSQHRPQQQQQPRHLAAAPIGHHQMDTRHSAGATTTNSNGDVVAASMSRRELSMMSEMRVQMNIHRQLLMKKRNQILLHSSDNYGDTNTSNTSNHTNNNNSSSSTYSGDGQGDAFWAARFPAASMFSNPHSSSSSMTNPEPHGGAAHGYQNQHMQSTTNADNDTSNTAHRKPLLLSRVPSLPDVDEMLMAPPPIGLRAVDSVWDLDMPSATTTMALPDGFLPDFNIDDQNDQNDADLFSFLNTGLWADNPTISQPLDNNNSSTAYPASGDNFADFQLSDTKEFYSI